MVSALALLFSSVHSISFKMSFISSTCEMPGNLSNYLTFSGCLTTTTGIEKLPLIIFLNNSFSFVALNGWAPKSIEYSSIPEAHISVAYPEYLCLPHISGLI
jgi:hypothetical protein